MEEIALLDTTASSETTFLNRSLFKYMTQELAGRISMEETENLYYFIGVSSGEDYCYNFLNLADSPEKFLEEITALQEPVCFSEISIHSVSPALETVKVSYSPLPGCKGKIFQHCKMRCQFLKGFISGILSTYTGKPYTTGYLCNQAGNEEGSSCCVSKFSLAAKGAIDVRKLWETKR